MEGIVSKYGVIESNNKKYQLFMTNIVNLFELKDNSLIGCKVEFDLCDKIPVNIIICFDNQVDSNGEEKEICLNQQKKRNSILINILSRMWNSITKLTISHGERYCKIEDIKVFRSRITIMLVCLFFSPLLFPLLIAFIMQFKITKHLADLSQDKKLVKFYWYSFGGLGLSFILFFLGINNLSSDATLIGMSVFILIFSFISLFFYLKELSYVTEKSEFKNCFFGLFIFGALLRLSVFLGFVILVFYVIVYFKTLYGIQEVRIIRDDKD